MPKGINLSPVSVVPLSRDPAFVVAVIFRDGIWLARIANVPDQADYEDYCESVHVLFFNAIPCEIAALILPPNARKVKK